MAESPPHETRAWLVKAWRDLETARRAAAGSPPFYDTAVYHFQQAAEKAVKAFLVHHDRAYEKTHDVEVLIDRAAELDPAFGQLADAADALTPYATRFRYPNATFAVEPERPNITKPNNTPRPFTISS
jgi:HEPN domain-containing protein